MADVDLSAERLRELLSYNPETGLFTWAVNRRGSARAGTIAGSATTKGYWRIRVDGHYYRAHRLAWLHSTGVSPLDSIDHINGNRADNRIANLRLATPELNSQNTRGPRPGGSSGYLGVSWSHRKRKWFARIGVQGKKVWIGQFGTPEEAHAAYVEAKRRLHAGCTI